MIQEECLSFDQKREVHSPKPKVQYQVVSQYPLKAAMAVQLQFCDLSTSADPKSFIEMLSQYSAPRHT